MPNLFIIIIFTSAINLLKQVWFSTAKKTYSNRNLLSHADAFDQVVFIGEVANSRKQNVVVNDGTVYRGFTFNIGGVFSTTDEKTVNVQTSDKCFNERIDREMGNIVDTVENRIQNVILTAVDNIITPRIELAVWSINASLGRDAHSITLNSERGERMGIAASFKNVSERNNTFHEFNANDETRGIIPDKISDFSVPGVHFDRHPTPQSFVFWLVLTEFLPIKVEL